MATTQVADVSVYPKTMDAPNESDPLTVAIVLKWIGYGCLTIITAVAVWIGWAVLNFFKKQFTVKLQEMINAANDIKAIAAEFKSLSERVSSLDKTDGEIKETIGAIQSDQLKMKQDISAIKKHLKIP